MTSDRLWVVLPGLTMAPEEYLPLARLLPGETRILDSWRVSVTAPTAAIRDELGVAGRPITLIGHSIGALAALEWTMTNPALVERVILFDPSSPEGSSSHQTPEGRAGRSALRTVARVHPLGRRLGLAARRRFLSGYGVSSEYLKQAVAAARYGTPNTPVFFWDELHARGEVRTRVRTLLDSVDVSKLPAIVQINTRSAPARDLARRRGLAARLDARLIEVDLGHLFPATDPVEAAAML